MKKHLCLLGAIFLLKVVLPNDSTIVISHQKDILGHFVDSLIQQKTSMENYHLFFGLNDELEFSLFKTKCEFEKITLDSCINLFYDKNTGKLIRQKSIVLNFLYTRYFKNIDKYYIRFVGVVQESNLYEIVVNSGSIVTYLYIRMAECDEFRKNILEILTQDFLPVFMEYE